MIGKLLPLALALALTTDMRQLAADLQKVLGADAVEIQGEETVVRGMSAASLVEAMNRERAAAGLRPLHLDAALCAAAGDRMQDMFAKHYFDHISPDGIDPFTWAERRGYDYRAIGENLATGYPTATSVVSGWMHSEGHRQNVLGAAYDEIGIAVADGSPKRPYRGPTVVALYGTR